MSEREKSCEERIGEECSSTEKWLSDIYKRIDEASVAGDDELEEGLREEVEPYGVSIKPVMTLELAGGGPSAWLEVELDQFQTGFEPVRVVFHYAWGDHAEREVSESEAPGMWRMAEYHAQYAASFLEFKQEARR